MLLIKPKSWDKFQHYKDRCPPWIKLHRDLLNNREFMGLPIASKAIAPLLWLLASESKDGTFDADLPELEFRLRISQKELKEGLKCLIDKGFFLYASNTLAVRYQDAIPETETETEREKKVATAPPEGVSDSVWQDFLKVRKAKRAPMTDTALKSIRSEAEKAGWSLEDVCKECSARGWTSFKAEWVTAKLASRNGVIAGAL